MKTQLIRLLTALALCASLHRTAAGPPPSTAFTYQGRLIDGGSPANGSYDLSFSLYNASSGGGSVAGPLTNSATVVTNGLFTVTLNFGSGVFGGIPYWLDISVRTNGNLVFTELSPRQQLTPSPYAIFAENSGAANSVVSNGVSAAALSTAGSPASGQVLSYNGSSLVWTDPSSGGSTGWSLTGNSATGADFLGTTNNEPLFFVVNGGRTGALLPFPNGSPSIQWGAVNGVSLTGSGGNVIAGGGYSGAPNLISTDYSSIGGGYDNQIDQFSPQSVIAGGSGHRVFASGDATIGGGGYNTISNASAGVIPGGFNNLVSGDYSFAAGNSAQATNSGAFVWADNLGSPFASTSNNQFSVRASGGVRFVTGGAGVTIDGVLVTNGVAPGSVTAAGIASGQVVKGLNGLEDAVTLLAGDNVTITPSGNTLTIASTGGGGGNSGWSLTGNSGTTPGTDFLGTTDFVPLEFWVNNTRAFRIEPGFLNQPNVIGGAAANSVAANKIGAAIGGGDLNTIGGNFCTVGGGLGNTNTGDYGAIGGGIQNVAFGSYSTVPGGYNNQAIGAYSFAGGHSAYAGYDGCFVWSDSTGSAFAPTQDSFNVVASGGINMNTGAGNPQLDLTPGLGAAFLQTGSGASLFLEDATASLEAGGASLGLNGSAASLVLGGASLNIGSSQQVTVTAPGGMVISDNTPSLSFGSTTRQMINLWNANYGIGVQSNDAYFRSANEFFWYHGGSHSDTFGDPGIGGAMLMRLGNNGNLTIAGTLTQNSDRNVKTNFAAVDARTVLERVAAMSLATWTYKTEAPTIRHLGPMAQDFYAAFGLGEDERHITTVDEGGVALAAIQGLNQKLERQSQVKDAEIQNLKQQNDFLAQRLNQLEAMVNSLAEKK